MKLRCRSCLPPVKYFVCCMFVTSFDRCVDAVYDKMKGYTKNVGDHK